MSLEKEYSDAKSSLSILESKKSSFVREKLNESERATRAEAATIFDTDIESASIASQLAYAAYMAEVETTAARDAPLPVGTVYIRWARESRGWNDKSNAPNPLKATSDTGVLEVVTRKSTFADNLSSYSHPPIGSLILRLRKKNGELGMKFVESKDFVSVYRTWFPEGHNPNKYVEEARKKAAEKKLEDWMNNPVLC